MATVAQYVGQFRDVVQEVAVKRGCDLRLADKQTRVVALAILTVLAVVVKTVVDKGLITNAELQATLDAARVAAYSDEPAEPPPVT